MSSAGRSEDSKEARFGHLLNPIRDLAQNWNIDVARDLEQYLEELEHIEVSFDGGITSLNFAEAARLIQVRCPLSAVFAGWSLSRLQQTPNRQRSLRG